MSVSSGTADSPGPKAIIQLCVCVLQSNRHQAVDRMPLQTKTTYLLLILLLHPFNSLFSRTTWVSQYQKVTTSLDLNEARDYGVLRWQWHQLDHTQTIWTSFQTDNHTNTSSINFYMPDALPDAQPTVSKHWKPNINNKRIYRAQTPRRR